MTTAATYEAIKSDFTEPMAARLRPALAALAGPSPGLFGRARAWRFRAARSLAGAADGGVKRAIDVMGAVFLLTTLTPLLCVVALLIKLTDGGPVLFWQTRVGRWGTKFAFPKFRSMVVDAEKLKDQLLHLNDHKNGVTFKMKCDPRVTWIGRIIRKLSIDELPQLWCVFRGEMSLVGPRPAVPREVGQYTLDDRLRLDVVPGLTCIWQVSGRGAVPFPRQVELDVEYILNRCLWLDLKLLFLTIPAVLTGRGAY
jgi:lipopolysaccharide/colanic/teichoic acid biosynthesis glycosyltransferase